MRIWFTGGRAYVTLFVIALLVRIATALPVRQAGYMDASYALHVAENIARGRGLVEDILWNYLDQPAGLPHPSNLYWMPLPSLLIAPFFARFGVSYRVAQIPFILLSSFLPLVAFYLARRIGGRDASAWMAALFTLFSGFYMVYWISPDNFTPFALTASLCLYVTARGVETQSPRYFFAAGILAALSHLSRADGLLLLAVPPLVSVSSFKFQVQRSRLAVPRYCLRSTVYCLLGYLLLMSPWFLRNYIAVGAAYPSAGAKTLWLTNYDEIFRFTDDLTPTRYFAWGIVPILQSKLAAGALNFLVVALGDLQAFLLPFAIIGLWQLRRRIECLPFFVYAPLLYFVMTLVFTFPSGRGSMLHSASALLPYLAAAAPMGIESSVRWIARRRRTWQLGQATAFFQIGSVGLAIFLSLLLYSGGIFGSVFGSGNLLLWNDRDAHYFDIARWLTQNARADDRVMVVDPPSFYNISARRAIMVPTDSVDAIFAAARRYDARYLVLEFDHPAPLKELYQGRAAVPGLTGVADLSDAAGRAVKLYEVTW